MNICPDCMLELVETSTARGRFWTCPRCGGRAENDQSLRQLKGEAFSARLFGAPPDMGIGTPCPLCSSYAHTVPLTENGRQVAARVCPTCHTVWLSREACLALQLDAEPQVGAQATSTGQTSASAPADLAPSSPGLAAPAKPASDKIVLTQEQQERIAAVLSATTAGQMRRKFSAEGPSIFQRILQVGLMLCGIPLKIGKKKR